MRKVLFLVTLFIIFVSIVGCDRNEPAEEIAYKNYEEFAEHDDWYGNDEEVEELPKNTFGQIYLFGELHGNAQHIDLQFDLWYNFYHNYDMRHLFIELPFFTAEFLNIWMQKDGIANVFENHEKSSAAPLKDGVA